MDRVSIPYLEYTELVLLPFYSCPAVVPHSFARSPPTGRSLNQCRPRLLMTTAGAGPHGQGHRIRAIYVRAARLDEQMASLSS